MDGRIGNTLDQVRVIAEFHDIFETTSSATKIAANRTNAWSRWPPNGSGSVALSAF